MTLVFSFPACSELFCCLKPLSVLGTCLIVSASPALLVHSRHRTGDADKRGAEKALSYSVCKSKMRVFRRPASELLPRIARFYATDALQEHRLAFQIVKVLVQNKDCNGFSALTVGWHAVKLVLTRPFPCRGRAGGGLHSKSSGVQHAPRQGPFGNQ